MNSKIQSHHQQRTAFVYLRQSTMHQVMHNQESTERQYALSQKAIDYGWSPSLVQILDGECCFSIEETKNTMIAGDSIILPAGKIHSVEATRPFKMLLTMIKIV